MGLPRADALYLRSSWLALILLLVPLLTVAQPRPAAAAGTVNQCSEAVLRAALAGGGLVTFSCSGTITLASPIELTADTAIDGGGMVTIDGQGQTHLFVVNDGVNVDVTGLTLTGGQVMDDNLGGAFTNQGSLRITASTFSDNTGSFIGGAILNDGVLEITASTFDGNSADFGGAIANRTSDTMTIAGSTFSRNSADFGGAIHNIGEAATIAASTFEGNQAELSGGAIYNNGDLRLTASTLAGNSANDGGAIASFNTTQVSFSTFAGNSATIFGGAIANGASAVALFANIFSGSSPLSCFGAFASTGYNVSTDNSCNLVAPGDAPFTDSQLGPLAYNGGPTQTMLPALSSPVIGRAPNPTCAVNSVVNNHSDQRGAPRPEGSTPCDSGAVELQVNSFFCVGERSGAPRYISAPNGCLRGEYRLLPVASGVYDFCVGERSGTMRYLMSSGASCLRGETKVVLPQVEPITICVGERSRTVRLVTDAAGCNPRGELPYVIVNPAG